VGIAAIAGISLAQEVVAQQLINALEIPGDATDLYPEPGANGNRLGGLVSDLWYDRADDSWLGVVDRGPGGGKIPYACRIERFKLDVAKNGAISNFRIAETIILCDEQGTPLDGQNPKKLGNPPDQQGRSFDAEGIAIDAQGRWIISDEYGPAVKAFELRQMDGKPQAWCVQTFTQPDNILPRDSSGSVNLIATPGKSDGLYSGRLPNRGLEALAITPNGNLYAMLQSPLSEEGLESDGERGRYIRIFEYDGKTGQPARQFLYELQAVEEVNQRIADKAGHFSKNKPGKVAATSALVALDDTRFLVLERDNRGIGVDNPNNADPKLRHVGSKRVYLIDISSATDASEISLRDRDQLPAGVRPVAKELFADLQAEMVAKDLSIPEKIEGIAIGPQLGKDEYLMLVGIDNDFSVTQIDGDTQYDVYTDGTQGPIDGPANGRKLLPNMLYSFRVKLPGYRGR
jgi:hypothetical protein